MSTNISNTAPYLRTSRHFPQEAQPLAVEVNKSYVDIANAVNYRTIGLISTNRSMITGENWFFDNNQRHQSTRQIFTFTSAGSIVHNIKAFFKISSRSCGEYTDGTNWYGVINGSSTAIAGQVSFYVTATHIVVLSGAGAPSISSGYVDLEWIDLV